MARFRFGRSEMRIGIEDVDGMPGDIFADGCLDSQIGKVVPGTINDAEVGRAASVGYVIADDRRSITVQIGDPE
jgi:hypothetical protein